MGNKHLAWQHRVFKYDEVPDDVKEELEVMRSMKCGHVFNQDFLEKSEKENSANS